MRSNPDHDQAIPAFQTTGGPTLVDQIDSQSHHILLENRTGQTELHPSSPVPSTSQLPPTPPQTESTPEETLSLCYPPNPSYILLALVNRFSQGLDVETLNALALLCAQNDDDLHYLITSPTVWDPTRTVLMNQGMNLMEWMAHRRSFFLQAGLERRDIDTLVADNSLFTFLETLPTPLEYRKDLFNRLGFYVIDDLRLLASLPSQWSTAMNYLLANGLPFAEWLSIQRGLRTLSNFKTPLLGLPAEMWTFLVSLRQPLVSHAKVFIEVGLDSSEDVDRLSLLEDQWNAVLGALMRDGQGLSASECLSLKDGLQNRRTSLRLKSYFEDCD